MFRGWCVGTALLLEYPSLQSLLFGLAIFTLQPPEIGPCQDNFYNGIAKKNEILQDVQAPTFEIVDSEDDSKDNSSHKPNSDELGSTHSVRQ